jgi:hypothetical protein
MRYLKQLGLLAVASATLMAFAGTASATSVTSSEGDTPNIVATSTNSKTDGSFVTVECAHSKIEGNVEKHGSGVTVEGAIDFFSFQSCNYQVTTGGLGSFKIHADVAETSRTGDGTITWTGTSTTIHTSIGSCVFTTSETDVGTLHGGAGAEITMKGSKLPRTGGNFLCGSSGTWTGTYEVTNPAIFEVH